MLKIFEYNLILRRYSNGKFVVFLLCGVNDIAELDSTMEFFYVSEYLGDIESTVYAQIL